MTTTENTTSAPGFQTALDRLDAADEWFNREVDFAIDSHETEAVDGTVEPLNRAAEAIEQAAQAIACARRTCNGTHSGCTSPFRLITETTLTLQPENVHVRWPCCVCHGWTEKCDFSVIAHDGDRRLGDVCEWCLEASSPELYARWRDLVSDTGLTEEATYSTPPITTVVGELVVGPWSMP